MRKLRVGRSQGEKALWLIQDACKDSHKKTPFFFFFPALIMPLYLTPIPA